MIQAEALCTLSELAWTLPQSCADICRGCLDLVVAAMEHHSSVSEWFIYHFSSWYRQSLNSRQYSILLSMQKYLRWDVDYWGPCHMMQNVVFNSRRRMQCQLWSNQSNSILGKWMLWLRGGEVLFVHMMCLLVLVYTNAHSLPTLHSPPSVCFYRIWW